MMIIKDDFLSIEELDELNNIIGSPFFPWFFQKQQTYEDDPFFCHILYCNDISQSEFYKPVLDIFKKHLNWISLYRLNVNLSPKIGSKSNFHTDTNGEENEEKMTTSIFYLNTNNGYTILEDGTKIESVANRMLFFDAHKPHQSTNCTDEKLRVNINFNYF